MKIVGRGHRAAQPQFPKAAAAYMNRSFFLQWPFDHQHVARWSTVDWPERIRSDYHIRDSGFVLERDERKPLAVPGAGAR